MGYGLMDDYLINEWKRILTSKIPLKDLKESKMA